MGVVNKNHAAYLATSIDNSSLYAGSNEAVKIVKALANQIVSFDIFGEIGVNAAIAFASAIKDSYAFEKEFQKNMLKIAAISTQMSDNMSDNTNRIIEITQRIPVSIIEATNALYSIVSAGYEGSAGMKILEVSAQASVAALTETSVAAKAITTILNAYQFSADKAGRISDLLFTTIKLGKTSFDELASSVIHNISTAATYGISIEEVLGAIVSLTNQGIPTSQAMTQISLAIQGIINAFGDTAFQGKTLQEVFLLISENAEGSVSKMKNLIGIGEGVAAILRLTGRNAQNATSDLNKMQYSVGATELSFQKMQENVDKQMILLSNNIHASLRPLGMVVLKEVSLIAKTFNEAFASGDLESAFFTLKKLLELTAVAWGTYRVAVIAAGVAENLRYQASLAHLEGMTKIQALLTVVKGKTEELTVAMLKNPYALMAAAIATLSYGLYRLWTYQTKEQQLQEKLNNTFVDFQTQYLKEEYSLNMLFNALKKANQGTEERRDLVETVNSQYGNYLPKLLTEKSSLEEINSAYKIINTSLKEQIALKIKNSATEEVVQKGTKKQAAAISKIRSSLLGRVKNPGLVENIIEEIQQTTDDYQKAGSTWQKAWGQAYWNIQKKFTHNLKLGDVFNFSMEDYIRSVFNTQHAISLIERQYAPFIKRLTGTNIQKEKGENKEKIIRSNKTFEKIAFQKRVDKELLELELQNRQDKINLLKDSVEKELAQIELNYDKEITLLLEKEKEWKKVQGGNLTKEQRSVLNDSYLQAWLKKEIFTKQAKSEPLSSDLQSWIDYNKQYGNYQEKKLAITKEYEKKIAAEKDLWRKKSLEKERDKELQELDSSLLDQSDLWIRMFSDVEKHTIKYINNVIQDTEQLLDYINGIKGVEIPVGFTEEQIESLKKDPEKVKAIIQELINKRNELERRNPFINLIQGFKDLKEAGEDIEKRFNASQKIIGGLQSISSTLGQLGSTLDQLGGKVGEVFGKMSDLINNTASLALTGLMLGGPIGAAIGGGLGLVTSLVGIFSGVKDNKKEKEIQHLQDQVDTLERCYNKLGEAIDKTYSSDASKLIGQQSKILEQQKLLIQNQIVEEENKKKTDKDRVKSWKNQLQDIEDQIQENKEKAKNAILGEEIKSAIDNFAQAYVDAWAAGDNKIKASKDLAKNMIKQMIVEAMKLDIAEPMKKIREQLLNFWADNYISDWEQAQIDSMVENLTNELEEQYGWADKYLKGEEKEPSREAAAKGIASMSQESANELNGNFNSLLVYSGRTADNTASIRESLSYILEIQKNGWEDVRIIKELTGQVQINTAQLTALSGTIASNTQRVAAGMDILTMNGLTLKR